MSTIEQSIEVNVPLRTAYNQWTQFETFPKFMKGIEEVQQIDDTHLRWRAKVSGKNKTWEAEITEQIPDQRIAWRSTEGAPNAGVVTFHRISDDTTRLMVQMDYDPDDLVEQAGDAMGVLKRRVENDLQQFKAFIEKRGSETGAWRGSVSQKGERGESMSPPI